MDTQTKQFNDDRSNVETCRRRQIAERFVLVRTKDVSFAEQEEKQRTYKDAPGGKNQKFSHSHNFFVGGPTA